jgi:flagellar hook protein FlgE
MASEVSTIQSLKAVDAWIDVINSNINGGVRTAYKASRLKFSGSNVDVARTGNATSLPLQFPESGLTTANTVIDFTQGAITASTENTHLAIQGEGFFLLGSPDIIETTAGANFGGGKSPPSTQAKFLLTRDGEFRTDANGFLRNSQGYYLLYAAITPYGGRAVVEYDGTGLGTTYANAVYNDLDNATVPPGRGVRLSNFLKNQPSTVDMNNNAMNGWCSTVRVAGGKQNLKYTQFGSTVYDFGYKYEAALTGTGSHDASITLERYYGDTVLNKSLEASNASMTQSVPELSLAQKLFSALTKVLQTKQTNVDGVLNLVR